MVEGDVLDLGAGQHFGRDAARNERFQLALVAQAAPVLVDELGKRLAILDLVDTRSRDVAGDRHELRARRFSGTEALVPGRTVGDDAGDVGKRFNVVDHGWSLVETLDGPEWRGGG